MTDRRPVVVLGATGTVGQRFVEQLADHPWFEVVAVAASERSAGTRYRDACHWVLPGSPPEDVAAMTVAPLDPVRLASGAIHRPIAFSALPASVALDVEPRFAEAGFPVCSNASAFRTAPDVPLVIPEVNPSHLALIAGQRRTRGWKGFIVTNPNCTVAGTALALKPLDDAFGLRRVFLATLQAVSGAGYPGVPSLDILGNVVPWIPGEETKIEHETALLLGRIEDDVQIPAGVTLSAQVHRVPVVDGHTVCLSLGFDASPTPAEAEAALRGFRGTARVQALPSAPATPILIRDEEDRPQPRFDAAAGAGMSVSVGRIRACPLQDLRLVVLAHNTLRGAAGAAILNAELLVAEGIL